MFDWTVQVRYFVYFVSYRVFKNSLPRGGRSAAGFWKQAILVICIFIGGNKFKLLESYQSFLIWKIRSSFLRSVEV